MTMHQLSLPLSLETVDSHAAAAFGLARGCLPVLKQGLLFDGDGLIRTLARDLVGAIERRTLFSAGTVNDLGALREALAARVAAGSRDVAHWQGGDEGCDPYCVVETELTAEAERLAPMLDRIRALHHAVEQVLDVLHAERALADARRHV